MVMNAFRLIGDILRLLAVIALPIKIWRSKSAAGVSGKTQLLYAMVCTARYLDLFTIFINEYNLTMKIVFLTLAYLTVYLIYVKFKDTYSVNEDSFRIIYFISIAAVLGVIFNNGWSGNVFTYPELLERGLNFMEITWSFSIFLEAVAIVPQLLMVYQDKTRETPSFIFYYLYAMGLYRAFYAMNWIYKYHNYYYYDVISESAGGVQVAIYVIFAFIYVMRESPYDKTVDTPIVVNI